MCNCSFPLGISIYSCYRSLRASENGKFSCSIHAKSTSTYKEHVDKVYFSRYDQFYNSPLPLYGFVSLSIGFTVFVSVIYSLIVSTRVDEIESSHEQQTDEIENHGQNRKTVYVFYFYFVHLVLRLLFGVIISVLQHTYFYPNGFELKFSCSLPPTNQGKSNINTPKNVSRSFNTTSVVTCENATASEKWLTGIVVSVTNSIVAFVIFVELIYLCCRRLSALNCGTDVSWSCDTEFVTAYFLRKRYITVPDKLELTNFDLNNFKESIDLYKQEVLNRPRAPDISYLPKTSLDDMYTDVVIHTERAKHEFYKNMKRHEMYDVCLEVPTTSIRLEKITDVFYPNIDTKNKLPRTILVIGRPGIGKTVLTEKVLRDWANEIDEYYCDKVVFFFKFRWFTIEEFASNDLKTFLRLGTGLSEENFENIYEEIAREPQKVILIFDGLDEFHGKPMSCLDQSRIIPNDPNTLMSAINLFIKLASGDILKGATVLVTSRPAAVDFYSKLDFDRNVEIIGFTCDKIEEYVTRFCDNNNRSDLKPKMWNHIKSLSELLHLCYIPVNSYIVCVTLSGCLSNARNETSALPTTLTELYQTVIDHFEKHHQRNADGNSTALEVLQKLQWLAFHGMENGQLVFDQKHFDEHMRRSGLLNSLSNPISPLQTQFCFIHLTIQEFFAARHAIETLAATEIKKFILDHIRSGKWHFVLQFIAGLLGEKIKMFGREYRDCVFAFAESLEVTNGEIALDSDQIFIMKCLRELDDEKIVKEANALKDVVKLDSCYGYFPPSDWAAVTFASKQMKKLAVLDFRCGNIEDFQGVLELLQKRCIKRLTLHGHRNSEIEHVFSAFIKSNCTLDHKHTQLTSLRLESFSMTDTGLSNICAFFQNGHARHLETLDLSRIEIGPFEISTLCEILNNDHCTELTELRLRGNAIGDEGANVLCNTLINGLCKLSKLNVAQCSLTNCCIPSLCKTLQDKRCQLTVLSLEGNAVNDDGVGMLFKDALSKGHCKLTESNLSHSSFTDRCIPSLCTALQDECCKLTALSLRFNHITDRGACMLFEDALSNEHCKLTELNLTYCSLTDYCIPSLSKALKDECCKLTVLSLGLNPITDCGARTLFEDALSNKNCKLTKLNLSETLLTDRCIPSLCKALQDECCKLTVLSLWRSDIYDDGACMLFEDALSNEHCALAELDLTNCSLTDRCIPSLCKALQDEHCKLADLSLYGNVISDEGASMLLKDALLKEHCKLKKLNLTDCRLTDDFISSLRKVLPKMNVIG